MKDITIKQQDGGWMVSYTNREGLAQVRNLETFEEVSLLVEGFLL